MEKNISRLSGALDNIGKGIDMSGPGTSSQSQQASQKTQPWAPAIPLLQNQLSQIGSMNLSPSAGQTGAAQNLVGAANEIPNFGGQIGGLANQYLNPNNPTLAPYLQSNYTNPYSNPVLSGALNSLNQQIASGINQQFAGAGRDPSGNAQASRAIAYGQSQADLPLMLGQYNQNVSQQMGALGAQLGLNQAGAGFAGATPGAYLQPGQAQLGANTIQSQLPLINAMAAEQATIPIAGLGGQSQGTAQSQFTPSPMQMAASLFGGGPNSAFSGMTGALSGGLSGLGNLFGPTMNWGGG
jgi:hypothetical protein